MKRVLITTGGGDCPGLNAVIRAIVKRASQETDWEVLGSIQAFNGVLWEPQEIVRLTPEVVRGIHFRGGTIIETTNKGGPFTWPVKKNDGTWEVVDRSDEMIRRLEYMGVDCVINIGGDGSQRISQKLYEKGLNIIGVPKTIDNDLSMTDCTFGFQTAVQIATEAVDKLVTTAASHNRVFVLEVMGRDAGWIALNAAIAGGAEVCLLPEFPYDVNIVKKRPFKRFQIQPVWRADRPQKGRYREFYQCDADVVGSDSLLYEIELIQMIDTVFSRFGVRVAIKLNNRKILAGIAESIGQSDKIVDITVAIDKLDKIGLDGVNAELADKGLPQDAIDKLQPIIKLSGSNAEKLDTIAAVLAGSETGLKGVEECRYILDGASALGLKNTLELDLTLARGLNYYTGAIFEVKALDVEIGSISGGGRYDNLTGIFGLPGVSGVGISFGADRIYDVLNQLDLYPKEAQSGVKVLFLNLGEQEAAFCLKLLVELRAKGIPAEIYPDAAKMKKQMAYANANAVPYVAIVGSNELAEGKVTLKNMESGEQSLVDAESLWKSLI